MTKTRAAKEQPADDATPKSPSAGGSYVRQGDGTLDRVAFTAATKPDVAAEAPTSTPADDAQTEG